MPDEVPVLGRHHRLALTELGEWLQQTVGAEQISEQRLRTIYPKRAFTAGWGIRTDFSGVVRELDLLVDREFPFSQPRIGLGGAAQFLVWPHVEEDGVLCLPASDTTHDAIEEAKAALRDAYELVSLNLIAPRRQDFQDEFLSYWTRDPRAKGLPVTSILRAAAPSRRIVVWHGDAWNIVAETEVALKTWFENRFGPQRKAPTTEAAAFIWLPDPLCPDQYPRTASDIWALSRDFEDARRVLRDLAAKSPRRILTVIGAESKNGPCLAAVVVPPPTSGVPGKKKNTQQNGFRKGNLPPGIASARFWNAESPVTPSKVSRADAPWIHGRGRDPKYEQLASGTIIIVGAGSVGAAVASQLAMAGVGRLVIIDPEQLTAANTGRHPLGAKFIDRYKAEAFAGELRQNYPHHTFEFRNDRWQNINDKDPDLFLNASLIVSVTGDWNTDDALNTWHVDRDKAPPIVYGWTEEHACAGHAVLINGRGGPCLGCGFLADGRPRFRLTRWPGSELNQEPGCGSVYQPYGPVELAHTVSLISELAIDVLLAEEATPIHRIWACRLRFLQSCGGQWTQEWLDFCYQRTEGGFETQREWTRDSACRVCGLLS